MALTIGQMSGSPQEGPHNYLDVAPPQATLVNIGLETAHINTDSSAIQLGHLGVPITPGDRLQIEIAEDTRIYVTRGRLGYAIYEQEAP